LDPVKILNGKCKSIWQRSDEGKRRVDAEDILWLLGWIGKEGRRVKMREMKNINEECVEEFVTRY
jgi:hypothetical protein